MLSKGETMKNERDNLVRQFRTIRKRAKKMTNEEINKEIEQYRKEKNARRK